MVYEEKEAHWDVEVQRFYGPSQEAPEIQNDQCLLVELTLRQVRGPLVEVVQALLLPMLWDLLV